VELHEIGNFEHAIVLKMFNMFKLHNYAKHHTVILQMVLGVIVTDVVKVNCVICFS